MELSDTAVTGLQSEVENVRRVLEEMRIQRVERLPEHGRRRFKYPLTMVAEVKFDLPPHAILEFFCSKALSEWYYSHYWHNYSTASNRRRPPLLKILVTINAVELSMSTHPPPECLEK